MLSQDKSINSKNVRDNLIRISLPDDNEEKENLWELTTDLVSISGEISEDDSTSEGLPHPSHYKKWFKYMDKIDLRRHLSEVEITLIEAALEKNKGSVTRTAECLKINRTTLIEKMKKLSIQKIPES